MSKPSIETAAIPASADAGVGPTTGPNNPTCPVHQEAWYDIEDGCYVFEDPLPLEKDGFTPAVVQGDYSLPGVSQDASSQQSDENAQCTSQEPGPDGLPQPKRKDGEHDCGENESELENDMLQAFKEPEDLSPANSPNPPHYHRPSPEPSCLQVDQEPDQSAPEVLRDASPLRTQSQETAVIPVSSEDELQKKAVDEAMEAEDDTNKPEQEELTEKRVYNKAENVGGQTQTLECRASSQVINSDKDEEDEEPRPAKRRKQNPHLSPPKSSTDGKARFANFSKSFRNTRNSSYCRVSRVALPRHSQTRKDWEQYDVQSRVHAALSVEDPHPTN